MRIGYLMNTYPMVSTTFIGREIMALETLGHQVQRYAIRRWPEELVDNGDRAEASKTAYLLGGLRPRLVARAVGRALVSPARFSRALGLTIALIIKARGRAARHLGYLFEAIVLRELASRDDVRHIHAHFSTNATAVVMIVEALGGPTYSFTIHGPDELLAPVENSLGRKIAGARFVACISQFARSQAMLHSDTDQWAKLRIVHCGVDPARYGHGPDRDYGKRLLFIGRLAAVKGIPLLLEAVAGLLADYPDLTLTIVGDGPDRARLEAQATGLGLAGTVTFVGYRSQDDVARFLEEHDILVLPSFAEGVPVVLMEAMASRLPVVASRIAGIPELVDDGVAGFLVPPGDLASLVERIGRLVADPELCQQMGSAGRMKVEAEFDVAKEASQMSTLLRAFASRESLTPRKSSDDAVSLH